MSQHVKYHRILNTLASITFGLLVLNGCTSTKMVIPHGDPDSMAYQIKGLEGLKYSQNVTIGPFIASDILWYWTGEIRTGDESEKMNTYGRSYSFSMMENEDTIWNVTCRLESNRTDFERILTGVRSGNRSYLKCEMKAEDGSERVASLHLINNENKVKTGRIGFGSETIEIKGSSGGGLFGGKNRAGGYYIRLNKELVSAIDVLHENAVWFDASINCEYINLISASAMALLLHDEIIAMK
ncbi:MAG: hypothetical protein ACNA8K_15645 [Cyclonatronaceae bacterium]